MASIFSDDDWTHEDDDGKRYTVVDYNYFVINNFPGLDGKIPVKSKRTEKRLSSGEELLKLNNWSFEIKGTRTIIKERKK